MSLRRLSAPARSSPFARPRPAAFAALALVASCMPAAAAETELEFLDGGTLRTSATVSVGLLYGPGARPDALGSPVSTSTAGAWFAGSNPAGLAFLPGSAVSIDVLPPVAVSVSDIADLEDRAATALDVAVEDYVSPDFEPTYASLDAQVGQQGGTISGAVAFAIGGAVVGTSIEERVSVSATIVEAGLEALAQAVKEEAGGDVVDIEMRCFADAALDVSFDVTRSTLAVGYAPRPDLGVGGAVSVYHGRGSLDAHLRADGVVSYGGQEYEFNDPTDPWPNALGASAHGGFTGSAPGMSAGVAWRPRPAVGLDLLVCAAPRLVLTGSTTTVENMIPAASEGDLNLGEVTASQPTLTEETVTTYNDPLEVRLPSFAGAALSLRAWSAEATLEVRKYWGGLGFMYRDHREGIALSAGIGGEIDFGGIRFGGGVLHGTLEGDSSDSRSVAIPLANVGMRVGLGESMVLDTTFLALPLEVFRMSLSYQY